MMMTSGQSRYSPRACSFAGRTNSHEVIAIAKARPKALRSGRTPPANCHLGPVVSETHGTRSRA